MCSWERWTILQDLALAIVINTSAMLLSGVEFQPASWYSGTCAALCTNIILQLILPVPIIGYAVTKKICESILPIYIFGFHRKPYFCDIDFVNYGIHSNLR